MGGSDVGKVSADVALVGLGRPPAEQLNGVVLKASAGRGGCGSDAEGVA